MKRLRSPYAILGGSVVLLIILVAIFAPFLARYDPTAQNPNAILAPISAQHFLGTDELGRDTLARVMFGARISLEVGMLAVALSLAFGVAIGLMAGYAGGWVETLLMRTMDGLLAFPALVLALAVTAMLGPNLNNAILAIGITGVPAFARLTRGQVLAVRYLDYVAAARAVGNPDIAIVLRHILPNIMAPLIVQTSIAIPAAILAEAALSFLGLGIQPPTPSWGVMINAAKGYLEQDPILALGPGCAIFVTVLAFNFVGDAVRDALDPRLQHL